MSDAVEGGREPSDPGEIATHEDSFSHVFAGALQGEPRRVVGLGPVPLPLPVGTWQDPADPVDLAIAQACRGATLDVGCGPGRLAEALQQKGLTVLGIDVVAESVAQTQSRGVAAERLDIYERIPHEGTWDTVLLIDGNIGIGGAPEALLRRCLRILGPSGRIVAEVAAPGVESFSTIARLEGDGTISKPFSWAVVGIDDIAAIAERCGLSVTEQVQRDERWAVVLQAQ